MQLQARVVHLDGPHEESHGLDGVPGSPFLASFF